MTAYAGRNLVFTWGGSSVLGVREKSVSLAGEAIDVTSGEDSGKRTLLSVAAQDEIEFTVSGVTKDLTLRNDWHAGTRTKSLVVTWPDGSTLTGNFFLSAYSEASPYNDAITFEATLLSAGSTTYVAGA